MKDVEMLEAEAMRVLQRIRAIPKTPIPAGKKSKNRTMTNDFRRNSLENGSYVEEAREEGSSALARVKMGLDAEQAIAVRAYVDRTSDTVIPGASSPPALREEHVARLRELKNWAQGRNEQLDDLIDIAVNACKNGVAPLTGVRYGAALLTRGGFVYSGCNIESNETTLSTSAEKMAILKAISAGENEFECMVLTWDQTENPRFPMPSGASRQYLAEFGDFEVVLVRADPARTRKELTTAELLPQMPSARATQGDGHSLGSPGMIRGPRGRSPHSSPRRSALRITEKLRSPGPAHVRKVSVPDIHATPVRDWAVRHVLTWLDQECDLPSYKYNFQEASVNGSMLLQLAPQDMQELLGVHHPLHLSKLQKGLQELRRREVMESGVEENDMAGVVDALRENEIVLVARLKEAFDQADTQGHRLCGVEQLHGALAALGFEIPKVELQAWVNSFGQGAPGLSFAQFVQAFFASTRASSSELGLCVTSPRRSTPGEDKNDRLLLREDGHVRCRENRAYSSWVEEQRAQSAQRVLGGGTVGSDAADTKLQRGRNHELALWLKGEDGAETSNRVKSFMRLRKRPALALNISQEVGTEDFARLKRIFDRADRDHVGEITRHEAARALSHTGMRVSAVEVGQYLRLQGLDSATPLDLFEFARAFAYFVKQRDIALASETLENPTLETVGSRNTVEISSSNKRWPVAYDPTGFLLKARKHRKHHKHRKTSKRRGRSPRSKRRARRSRSWSSSSGSSSSESSEDSSSDSASDSSESETGSSESDSGSSGQSSGSDSSRTSTSASESDSDSASTSSSASSSRSHRRRRKESRSRHGKKSKTEKRKPVVMGRHVVRKVERAFEKHQKSGSRGQLAMNNVLMAFKSIPRSGRSKPLPSADELRTYFRKEDIYYYVTRKQFVRAYARLCYDVVDEDYEVKSTSRSSSARRRRDGSGSDNASGSDAETWRKGDIVEARARGSSSWRRGELTRVNADRTVNILYDDGDTERSVRPSLLRRYKRRGRRPDVPELSSGSDSDGEDRGRKRSRDEDGNVRRGDRVEARFKGGSKWYKGRVTRVGAGGRAFDIDYDDGDKERSVPASRVRRLDSGSSRDQDDDALAEGDRVEARFKGGSKWYKGKIVRVNADGSYNIDYDDGDQERRVAASKVRKLGGSNGGGRRSSSRRGGRDDIDTEDDGGGTHREGDRVEARFKGGSKWYKGKITRVNADGTFNIDYDDGDKERRVASSKVRKLGGGGGGRGSPRRGGRDEFDTEDDAGSGLREGDRVEARFKGGSKWYKGKITRVNADGSYNIDYDDGDQERRVASSKVRKLGGGAGRGSPRRGGRDEFDTEDDAGGALREGDRVEARYKGGSKWYKGKISRVNADGSYNIDYDDGDKERRVAASKVRKVGGGSRGSPRRGTRDEFDTEDDAGGSFREGDRVEARYKGGSKWYKGKITRVNADGSYNIDYDDGDQERRVIPSKVRKLGGGRGSPRRGGRDEFDTEDDAGGALREGDRVEARYKGGSKYYKGKISRVNADGSYNIDYDDGDKERRVASSKVRKLGGGGRSSPRRGGRGDIDTEDDAGGILREGDRVEARYKGGAKWYKGKITRVNADGSYNIDYDDGDQERRVASSKVRKLGGGAGRGGSPRRGGRDEFDTEDDAGGVLREGDRVEARYKGGSKYYKGKISRINADGSYNIDYDDGDQERRIAPSKVRKLGGSPRRGGRPSSDTEDDAGGVLREGDRVEARYKGGSKYYKGKISRVNADGSYNIDYDDGDQERRVAASKVRKLGGGGARAGSPRRGGRDELDTEDDAGGALREGDRVEARYKGGFKWYKGRISRVNADGSYNIDYDDGDQERRIAPSKVRKLEGNKPGRGGRPSSDTEDDAGGVLREGDRVEARYKGGSKYYKGKISRVNADGSYNIDYDDGDQERRVIPSKVRKLGGGGRGSPRRGGRDEIDTEDDAGGVLREGDRVEARYKGGSKYYKGKITRVNADGSYNIDYDDGDQERRIAPSKVRKLGGSPRRGGRDEFDTEDDASGALREGDRVEARYKGGSKYYKGKISRVNADGSYNIDYDDGDQERRVIPSKVRKLGGGGGGGGGRGSPRRGGGGRPSSDTEGDDAGDVLREGDRVEARYKGGSKYYKGQISRVNADGSYNIDYDDGDKERRVIPSKVRKLGGGGVRGGPRRGGRDDVDTEDDAGGALRQGDRVEARYKGGSKYYKGKISRVNADGSYNIDYDDGDQERRVIPSKVRKLGGDGGSGDFGRGSPRRGARPSSDTEDDAGGVLREGDRVEARYKGGSKYYKGKISRVNADGSYNIDYDDGDQERRVASSKVRKLGGSPRHTGRPSSDTDDDFGAKFREGDRVEAQFKGGAKYYKGIITRVNADGSCNIDYDDGDQERRVAPSKVRKLGDSGSSSRQSVRPSSANMEESSNLRVGDRVEARFRGQDQWYPGSISCVNRNGTYDIAYDDGDADQSLSQIFERLYELEMGAFVPRRMVALTVY
ncbi:Cytidine deaminase [Hondaea fermentalgiana]|uniref:Cytidine deaminase n=1 Tax=Hondaea fermentalgiana TaxID=2315210 RepID=A0A2R5GDF6_9STRA|nr:Cytidine deaminase [Hondaea fermentalgiana]|eukprot:GBG28986.1 Cytidine deaminase [Hondaea fermentalgiana]